MEHATPTRIKGHFTGLQVSSQILELGNRYQSVHREEGHVIVSLNIFFVCFCKPPLPFSVACSLSLSDVKKGTDKHAVKGIVVGSAGQVGEINRSRLWGLTTALFGIGGAVGCSTCWG